MQVCPIAPAQDRLRPSLTEHSYLQLRLLARHLRTEASALTEGPVIDLGCGAKPYASLFPRPYLGFDLVATRADGLARAEALPVRTGVATAVVSTQQLEHVDEPVLVLAEARRVLAPGGLLLLSTHGVWPYHPDPHDLWRWTEEGLRRLITEADFTVDRVHRQGELFATAVLLAIYPLGGLRRSRNPLARGAAGALLAVANLIGLGLDAAARTFLPRHYASPSYLVVAHASP